MPKVLAYCRKVFAEKVPFDYELSADDSKLYCIEMTEKAFRAAGLKLSDPIKLGDMERAPEYPLSMLTLRFASEYALERPLTFDQLVYFPGNERYGIWSAKQMMTAFPPTFAPGIPTSANFRRRARFSTHRRRHEIGGRLQSLDTTIPDWLVGARCAAEQNHTLKRYRQARRLPWPADLPVGSMSSSAKTRLRNRRESTGSPRISS